MPSFIDWLTNPIDSAGEVGVGVATWLSPDTSRPSTQEKILAGNLPPTSTGKKAPSTIAGLIAEMERELLALRKKGVPPQRLARLEQSLSAAKSSEAALTASDAWNPVASAWIRFRTEAANVAPTGHYTVTKTPAQMIEVQNQFIAEEIKNQSASQQYPIKQMKVPLDKIKNYVSQYSTQGGGITPPMGPNDVWVNSGSVEMAASSLTAPKADGLELPQMGVSAVTDIVKTLFQGWSALEQQKMVNELMKKQAQAQNITLTPRQADVIEKESKTSPWVWLAIGSLGLAILGGAGFWAIRRKK